jgi:hypothetical protein
VQAEVTSIGAATSHGSATSHPRRAMSGDGDGK